MKPYVWEASVSLSSDRTQMAYSALSNEGYRVFKMDLNTQEYIKIPDQNSGLEDHLTCPVWNSDNSRIYFIHAGLYYGPVYSMLPDGNDLIQVTEFHVFRSISAACDDSFIVYASAYESFDDPPQGIYLYNIQEDTVVPVITYDFPITAYGPVLSPDGQQVAFVLTNWFAEPSPPPYYRKIMIVNIDGSDARVVKELPMVRNVANTYVTWSPDGTKLAFNISRGIEEDYYPQIYIINTDGTNMTQVTFMNEFITGLCWIE